MIKVVSLLLIICGCLVSCSSQPLEKKPEDKTTLELSIRKDFRHIKLDFYSDSLGNIYHRTVDVSTLEGNGYYSYRSYVRVYENDQTSESECKELKGILNTKSFHRVDSTSPDNRTAYFEDENYNYSLFSVADGGVLSAHPK